MKLALVFLNGKHRGKRLVVPMADFTVGRSEDCDLVLSGRSVSRRHCTIRQMRDRVVIVDLGSTNGVVVNGTKLGKAQSAAIWHHDLINIGKWELRISLRDSQTKHPIFFTDSDTEPYLAEGGVDPVSQTLLKELDQLTDGFDSSAETSSTNECYLTNPNLSSSTVPPTAEQELAAKVDEESETTQKETQLTTHELSDDSAAQEVSGQDAKPGKLPKTLRPTAANSRDAAKAAIEKYFTTRGP